MTSRVPKEIITTRTMRDTLLRTRTMTVIEEFNKMVINPKGPTAKIIPVKGTTRRGDFMAIRKGETTTKTSVLPMAIKTGDAMAIKREGAMAHNKTGDAIAAKREVDTVPSKIGEAMVEVSGALTATKKEDRTGTSREVNTALLTGEATVKEATTGTEKRALTRAEPQQGNVAQEWENATKPVKEAKV